MTIACNNVTDGFSGCFPRWLDAKTSLDYLAKDSIFQSNKFRTDLFSIFIIIPVLIHLICTPALCN